MMSKRWRVTTPCLKGHEVGDVIVESGNEDGGYIKENAVVSIVIGQEVFDAAPQFFEEIVEPVELPTVFGACDDNGKSFLQTVPAPENMLHSYFSEKSLKEWVCDFRGYMKLENDNLFPKDVPIELRLVPADQPVIPWRKWEDSDWLKKESFSFIAVFADGRCISGSWERKYEGIWGFNIPTDESVNQIKLYCPLSEIKMPGGDDEQI